MENHAIPLNHKDEAALDKIFADFDVDLMHQIDVINSYYSVPPLDYWEEKGWVQGGCLSDFEGCTV